MENFNLGSVHDDVEKSARKGADSSVDMSVSPICVDDAGKKYAFITFSDGYRTAEGKIPSCEILTNKGYTDEEVTQLEEYMRNNLSKLKSMAAGIDILKAFMK